MKTPRSLGSSLAIALLALMALLTIPAPAVQAQSGLAPAIAPVPVGSTITGIGRGPSVLAADTQATANLAAERARLTAMARGPIRWGPITRNLTLIPGGWWSPSQYQVVLTQTWAYR